MQVFHAKDTTSYAFANPTSRPLLAPFRLAMHGTEMIARSVDGKLFLLCSHLVATRNYDAIIQELNTEDERDVLYFYFAFLLGDINFLKITGQFRKVKHTLIARLRESARIRFEREKIGVFDNGSELDYANRTQIEEDVEIEAHLVYGLSLLAFLDQDHDYSEVINFIITCDKTPEEWLQMPINLAAHFGAERWALTLSMLIYFSAYHLRRPSHRGSAKAVKNTVEIVEAFLTSFDEQSAKQGIGADKNAMIKTNFQLLLEQIGVYDRQSRHQVIRYLQRELVSTKAHHNKIASALSNICHELDAIHTEIAADLHFEVKSPRRLRIPEERRKLLKPRMEIALYHVGVLEDIADRLARLFEFAKFSKQETSHFLRNPKQSEFMATVNALGNLLVHIQTRMDVSKVDIEAAYYYTSMIYNDLFDEGSVVQKALHYYIVNLEQHLAEAMAWANKKLGEHLPYLYTLWHEHFSTVSSPTYVLIDPQLLVEVLRNICSNVRHQFPSRSMSSEVVKDVISVSIDMVTRPLPEMASEHLDFARLTIVSHGPLAARFPTDKNHTLAAQRAAVEEWGGQLHIQPEAGNARNVSATLELIARKGTL